MIIFGYQILRKEKEEMIAEGETRHLCLDSNGKPKRLPQEFAIRLTG
jgi:acyl-CoA thioesterase FadM